MGTVAPHQHNEVRLVMNGRKPLATIEFEKDSSGYAMAVCLISAGMLRGSVRPTEDCAMGEVVFTLPLYHYMIDEYNELLRDGIQRLGLKGYHRRMGQLFGYTSEDIEAFIASEINCECAKCTGSKQ